MIEAAQRHPHTTASPMLQYIRNQMLNISHSPISTLLKSSLILKDEHYQEILNICWHLLIHRDTNIVASAG